MEQYIAHNAVGTFGCPQGWNVTEETGGRQASIYISPEKWADNSTSAKFAVGLTATRIIRVREITGKPASMVAADTVERLATGRQILLRTHVKQQFGEMEIIRVLIHNASQESILHMVAIGLDERDDLFLIMFETPKDLWNDYLPISRQLLNSFLIGVD